MARILRWYIEPLGHFTNEMIAGIESGGSLNVSHIGVLRTPDGEPHDVWECPHQLFKRLREDGRTGFLMFRRRGDGALEAWNGFSRIRSGRLEKRISA
ncbi:MAG: hypothetical protein AAB967_02875 [Patescibacteria group bacterium]